MRHLQTRKPSFGLRTASDGLSQDASAAAYTLAPQYARRVAIFAGCRFSAASLLGPQLLHFRLSLSETDSQTLHLESCAFTLCCAFHIAGFAPERFAATAVEVESRTAYVAFELQSSQSCSVRQQSYGSVASGHNTATRPRHRDASDVWHGSTMTARPAGFPAC